MAPTGNSQIQNGKQDAFEAYQTFRAGRTFFFILILFSLAILQTIFWTVNKGNIDDVLDFDLDQSQSVFVHQTQNNPTAIFTADPAPQAPEAQPDPEKNHLQSIQYLNNIIRGSLKCFNTLICFMAILYCLSLLIGLNITIVGRLGGLGDSAKAFFLSLVVLILILPWQSSIAVGAPGTLFSYSDLINRYILSTTHMPLSLDTIAYYIRFTGFPALTTLLLLATQWRASRASKQIIQNAQPIQTPPPFPAHPQPQNQYDNSPIPVENENTN